MKWKGVMPAITTCFDEQLRVDHDFMAKHCLWLLENGCSGVVLLGSLGEGATLSFEEKHQIVQNCVKAVAESRRLSRQFQRSPQMKPLLKQRPLPMSVATVLWFCHTCIREMAAR